MIPYDFTRQAERMFLKLPRSTQQRILRKVESFLSQPNPLQFANRLVDSPVVSYRFRIGDYRVIFDWEGTRILITKVGHRRDVYRA